MAEYITKQQAIDLVKSMEVLIGCTGVSVLTKGIEGMEATEGQQRWISTKDRMPAPFVTVIVQMPLEAPFPTVSWGFITGDGNWHCNHLNRDEGEVTHWMYLPKPPKE